MHRLVLIALLLVFAATAAEDQSRSVVTTDGTTYKGAQITELRPSGVVLTTDSGIEVLPYAQLPYRKQLLVVRVPILPDPNQRPGC